jgi:hypothetical protein
MRIAKKYNKSISGDLIGDIRRLIETARHTVAVTVNAGYRNVNCWSRSFTKLLNWRGKKSSTN